MPVLPACELPKDLVSSMVAAGAHREELEGEDLRIVRIDGVQSEAWQLYATWACSLGEVDPIVQAGFAPVPAIAASCLCPPLAVVGLLLNEAHSIINLMAPLLIDDFPAAMIPVLTGPLLAPVWMSNVHHAKVAVTALLHALSNPGVNFPVINAVHSGHYICHVAYTWRGAIITVPVFRS